MSAFMSKILSGNILFKKAEVNMIIKINKGFGQKAKWFLGALFFARWQWVKNNESSWPIFVQAIWTTTFYLVLAFLVMKTILICLSYTILPCDVNDVIIIKASLTWIAAVFVNYWHMDMIFGRKWNYASDLYNKVIIFDINNCTLSSQKRSLLKDIIATNLAIDLLQTDLWAKKTFKMQFENIMQKAIQNSNNNYCKKCITEQEAWEVLESFLGSLKEKRNRLK